MLHRTLTALLVLCLLVSSSAMAAVTPLDARSQPPGVNAVPAAPQEHHYWPPSPELLAQGAGAVVGFGVFSFFVAPQATAIGGAAEMLTSRLAAASLAGAGAIGGTYLYDFWNGLPVDYAYFWHRGGFLIGLAGGVAVFGVIGYPLDSASSWFGWAVNRTILLGSGLYGSWTIDRWYQAR